MVGNRTVLKMVWRPGAVQDLRGAGWRFRTDEAARFRQSLRAGSGHAHVNLQIHGILESGWEDVD